MCSLLETLRHMQLRTLLECPRPRRVGGEVGHRSQAPCPASLDSVGTLMGPKHKLSSFCEISPCTQFYLPTQMGSSVEPRLSFGYTNMHRQGLHTQAQSSSQHLEAQFPIDSQHYRSQDKSGSLKVFLSVSSYNVYVIVTNFRKFWL